MLCNCCEFVFFYFKEKIRKFVTDSFACLLLEADTAALGALMASYPCGAVLFLPELVRDCSWWVLNILLISQPLLGMIRQVGYKWVSDRQLDTWLMIVQWIQGSGKKKCTRCNNGNSIQDMGKTYTAAASEYQGNLFLFCPCPRVEAIISFHILLHGQCDSCWNYTAEQPVFRPGDACQL